MCERKFEECDYCINRHDEDICDECGAGEFFEEDLEVDEELNLEAA